MYGEIAHAGAEAITGATKMWMTLEAQVIKVLDTAIAGAKPVSQLPVLLRIPGHVNKRSGKW
jgi:hypothetical protein